MKQSQTATPGKPEVRIKFWAELYTFWSNPEKLHFNQKKICAAGKYVISTTINYACSDQNKWFFNKCRCLDKQNFFPLTVWSPLWESEYMVEQSTCILFSTLCQVSVSQEPTQCSVIFLCNLFTLHRVCNRFKMYFPLLNLTFCTNA